MRILLAILVFVPFLHAQTTTYTPLLARDLSLANTTAPALKTADLTAITTDLGPKIIPWLLDCSRTSYLDMPGEGDNVYRRGAVSTGSKIDAFFETSWLSRALIAYMQVRHLASAGEKRQIENWFKDNATFTHTHMHSFLRLNFPSRLEGDYETRKGFALQAGFFGETTTYHGDSISNLSQWYNNRRSMSHLYLLLAGIAFANTDPSFSKLMIDEVKTYVKEWVMFSVYPTGEVGEWVRNHEYPNANGDYIEAQGVTYNAYNSALALNAALLLSEKLGDTELLEFRTRKGMWGTECGTTEPEKSIWTASDLHINMLVGKETRVNSFGVTMQVLYDYDPPETYKRNQLVHASWYLPAYRILEPQSPVTASLNSWLARVDVKARADDPFGLWRNLAGISQDTRSEDYSKIQPFTNSLGISPHPIPNPTLRKASGQNFRINGQLIR